MSPTLIMQLLFVVLCVLIALGINLRKPRAVKVNRSEAQNALYTVFYESAVDTSLKIAISALTDIRDQNQSDPFFTGWAKQRASDTLKLMKKFNAGVNEPSK